MAPLLEVKDLTVHFPVRRGLLARQRHYVHAVDNASFTLAAGATLGLVGESGCGKTTTGLAILRLIPFTSGQVIFQGQDLSSLNRAELRHFRREMQIIFQDPYASLDPRMPIGEAVMEGLNIHKVGHPKERWEIAITMLKKVGLEGREHHHPNQLSGGQQQRGNRHSRDRPARHRDLAPSDRHTALAVHGRSRCAQRVRIARRRSTRSSSSAARCHPRAPAVGEAASVKVVPPAATADGEGADGGQGD